MKLSKMMKKKTGCITESFLGLKNTITLFCVLFMALFISGILHAEPSFYSIQTSSNKYLKSAEAEVEKLKAEGFKSFYRYESIKDHGNWYKVYIGKYTTMEEAKIVVDSIKDMIHVKYSSITKIVDPNMPVKPEKMEKQYILHISSFRTGERAEREVTRLQKLGMNAFSKKEIISGNTWFRVYLGGFSDRAAADKRGFELKQARAIAFYKIIHKKIPVTSPEEKTAVPEIKTEDEEIVTETVKASEPPVAIEPTLPMGPDATHEEVDGETLKEKYLKEMEAKQKELALEEAQKAFDMMDFSEDSKPDQIRFKDLMHELLSAHDLVKYSEENIKYAQFILRESKSGYMPTLDLSSDCGYEIISKENVTDDTKEFRNSSSLKAKQLLTDFGRTSRSVSKSKSMLKRSEYELEAVRQQLILEGITAYLNVIRNREILKYFKKSEANIKKQTGIEETLVQKGAGLSSNVLQAKAQLSNSKALVAIAYGALETAKNNFRAIFKKSLTEEELNTLENPPLRLVPTSIDTAIETALKKNLNISMAQLDAKLLQKELQIKKTAFYPQINLFADETYSNNEDGIEAYKNEASVGIELSYNLYRGGGDKALLNAAQSSLSASEHQLSNTRHLIEEQVRNAWQNLDTLKIQTKLLEDQSNIAAEFLKLARKERRLGNRSLLDILNGEITYINAVSSAISSKIDMKIAVYHLLYASGQLNLNVL